MAITKDEARVVTRKIEEAVASILAAHGLAAEFRTTYGDHYVCKITGTTQVLGEDGFDYGTTAAKDWLLYGTLSLDADGPFEDPRAVLGKVVVMRGEEYRFMGYSARGRKYPLLFQKVSDGKTYKFTEHALRNLR
jgi:hypothetical protein